MQTVQRDEKEGSVNENAIVELDQVVAKVNKTLLDVKTYSERKQNGTLDQYYLEIITSIAYDMVVMPVKRELAEMEPLDDMPEVLNTLARVANAVSMVFSKPISQVQTDLIKTTEQFPSADLRQAAKLRHKNLLH